ncbi:hypothetical protein [Natrialba sp. SSL1]|uniref:hypothetical protein n=1 Tax=Natrialba sp. SSL1 TaxID=1869245 RepID=UPI0008F8748E|nr:hypothetical protein [Natrialba sp. SSL1]OIB55280.1 hypothetical protein BBD46_05305 [Natrialba sp. SSL1]
MSFERIVQTTEESLGQDRKRREVFQEELSAYEQGECTQFNQTREAIARQQDCLETLKEYLEAEQSEIGSLIDQSEFLNVDQAVQHREEAIEKLSRHNEFLLEYVEAVQQALEKITQNLETVEAGNPDNVEADPEPNFNRARKALENHNKVVDGLGKNMRILNAYLM